MWQGNCRMLTCLAAISPDGTFTPGQWVLKRLKKVEDAPADNHIIVQTHKATHLQNDKKREFKHK